MQLPLFCFKKNRQTKHKDKGYEITWTEDDRTCTLKCIGTYEYGIPGAFEQDVYAAILRIWVWQAMPGYINITYTEIANTLNINNIHWCSKIKNALLCLCTTRYLLTNCYKTENGFSDKTMIVTLIEGATIQNETDQHKYKTKSSIILSFPQIIKDNLDKRYYQMLNLQLYKQLKPGHARRLYEYLEKRKNEIDDKTHLKINEVKLIRWLLLEDKNKARRVKRIQALAQNLIDNGYLKAAKKVNLVWHFYYAPQPEYKPEQPHIAKIEPVAENPEPAPAKVAKANPWGQVSVGDKYNGQPITHVTAAVILTGGGPVAEGMFNANLWEAK